MDLKTAFKADELKDELIEISRFIHANPELGYQEKIVGMPAFT